MVARKTKATKTKKSAPADEKPQKAGAEFDYSKFYGKLVDKVDKEFSLSTGDFSPACISSGLLCVDSALAGGYRPALSVTAGFEAAAKSTLLTTTLAEALKMQIPIIRLDDAENTFDPLYGRQIIGEKMENVFGQKVNGKWVNRRAMISYNNSIDVFFNSLARLLSRLPDKVYNSEKDQFYFRVPKHSKKFAPFMEMVGDKIDKSQSKNSDHYIIPTQDRAPQAFLAVDSFATLVPESVLEKEELSNALGIFARKFAENLPRIVGYIRPKCVVMLGVNQLRERPGVAFGNPIYEFGGNALKLYSSNRSWLSARAVPDIWKGEKKGTYSEEESVEFPGETDRYAFKHFKNVKLKSGTPFQETWTRVWIRDGKRRGRGFCRAFDAFQFLSEQKLVTVEKKKGKLILTFSPKFNLPIAGKSLSWAEFKTLILYETNHAFNQTDHLKEAARKIMKANGLKNATIYKECQRILNNTYKNL